MKAPFFLLATFLGFILAIHLGMNGKVGAALNNARVGNAVFWAIGGITALIIGLTGWQSGALAPLKTVSPLMLTAGAMGACLVFGIAWLIPKIGGNNMMLTLLAGQIIGGMLMSHFGWLGSPQQPITVTQLVGVVVMVAGVVIATFFK
jgi:bacterial/archaeal transporter family-2 protein